MKNISYLKKILGVFLSLCWFITQPALAMLVKIVPQKIGSNVTCNINSVKNVVFGNYDVFSNAAVTSQGNVVVQCTGSTSLTIQISPGNNGATTQRYMNLASSSNHLLYNVYSDAAMLNIWGDDNTAPAPTFNIPDTKPYTFIIYAKIASTGQNVDVGSYMDNA